MGASLLDLAKSIYYATSGKNIKKKASLKWLDWEACEYCHATLLTRLLWPTTKRYRHHRGQTSKSLFLFFIAGISFTS